MELTGFSHNPQGLSVPPGLAGPTLSALRSGAVMGGTFTLFLPTRVPAADTPAAFCRGDGSAHGCACMELQHRCELTQPARALGVGVNLPRTVRPLPSLGWVSGPGSAGVALSGCVTPDGSFHSGIPPRAAPPDTLTPPVSTPVCSALPTFLN